MTSSLQPTLWRTCRVLANRKRLQILRLLLRRPKQTVSAIAKQMNLSLPAASQYLRALEARGLLTCSRVRKQVAYRPCVTTAGAAGEIVSALQLEFRRAAQPNETIFKLATAFTHPRRLEVFRAVKGGANSFRKLQSATQISAPALSRHVAKLEARGFIMRNKNVYVVANQARPFGCALARLARK